MRGLFTEEIKMGINITNGDYSNVRETGTLAFRTALLMERWKYICRRIRNTVERYF